MMEEMRIRTELSSIPPRIAPLFDVRDNTKLPVGFCLEADTSSGIDLDPKGTPQRIVSNPARGILSRDFVEICCSWLFRCDGQAPAANTLYTWIDGELVNAEVITDRELLDALGTEPRATSNISPQDAYAKWGIEKSE